MPSDESARSRAGSETATHSISLRITRRFDAPRPLLWQAWTRREHLMHWLCPKDFQVLFAELDLCVGGAWQSGMRAPDGSEYIAGGVYERIDEPHRLVFTHRWEKNEREPISDTTVTVTLEEEAGGTVMTFEQTGFATIDTRDSHKGGWSEAFDNLAGHLRDAPPFVSDREIIITRIFQAPRELVWRAWTEPGHVAQWWGPRGFTTTVTELDLNPGGRWRYVMTDADGKQYPVTGVFQEVVPPERTVTTVEFDQEHEPVNNVELPRGLVMTCILESCASDARATRLTLRIDHATGDDRRRHEAMGVMEGWNSSFDCLAEHLTTATSTRNIAPGNATMSSQSTADEAQLHEMIDQWRDAVQRKDIEGVMANYSPKMVSFDAWGELQNPAHIYRDHWEQCFAGHDGPIHFDHHDLRLAVSDDVAFCHCLIHMAGKLKDGTEHSFWGRGTIGFEKIDGRWQVTHEHASAPFDPMTGQACMDLKP